MDSIRYAQAIKKAYEEEIGGEHWFRYLAEHCRDKDETDKLSTLADLEREIARKLAPIVTRLGMRSDEAQLRIAAESGARPLRALSWPQFIETLLVELPPYIAAYDALCAAGPPEDAPTLEFLVEHERALLAFAQNEHARPRSVDSLERVHALLGALSRVPGTASPGR